MPAAAALSGRAAAVLFDMDGLLIDSEPLWTVAEVELAATLGAAWSTELKASIIGTRLDVAVPAILDWYGAPAGPDAVAGAMAFLLRRMVELFATTLPMMPGALDLVDAVRRLGVPTGLVSSSYRVLVDAALGSIGAGRFDVTLAGDEVVRAKPSPEPYLRACELLGVAAKQVVVLEDAPSGVAAGEAAGATVVAVPSIAPIEATPWRPVVSSLTAVDPEWLVHHALPASSRA
jgi:HAD superfamily hydrolase (TIGR01509 family)